MRALDIQGGKKGCKDIENSRGSRVSMVNLKTFLVLLSTLLKGSFHGTPQCGSWGGGGGNSTVQTMMIGFYLKSENNGIPL